MRGKSDALWLQLEAPNEIVYRLADEGIAVIKPRPTAYRDTGPSRSRKSRG